MIVESGRGYVEKESEGRYLKHSSSTATFPLVSKYSHSTTLSDRLSLHRQT